jgi:release factor glutamine methyltransferase
MSSGENMSMTEKNEPVESRDRDGDAAGAKAYVLRVDELARGLSTLADKPEETPDTTLRALWHLACGNCLSAEAAAETRLPTLDSGAEKRLAELIRQRIAGVPLAHLTGRQRFMGIELLAGKEALIPRHETELLGRGALDLLRRIAGEQVRPLVIDVCTGSGNLALALARHVNSARVFAADLSADAVALARRNAQWLGLGDRVEVREGDLLAPFEQAEFFGNVDLLTCNPPYISSKKVDGMPGEIVGFEPRLAFDGGPLGVKILQRLVREAPRYLKTGGWLAFEVGFGQGRAVMQRLKHTGAYSRVESVSDASGEIRAILACM